MAACAVDIARHCLSVLVAQHPFLKLLIEHVPPSPRVSDVGPGALMRMCVCCRCHHSETGEHLWTVADGHRGGMTTLALSGNERFTVRFGKRVFWLSNSLTLLCVVRSWRTMFEPVLQG
jgi:hypothetical protein